MQTTKLTPEQASVIATAAYKTTCEWLSPDKTKRVWTQQNHHIATRKLVCDVIALTFPELTTQTEAYKVMRENLLCALDAAQSGNASAVRQRLESDKVGLLVKADKAARTDYSEAP